MSCKALRVLLTMCMLPVKMYIQTMAEEGMPLLIHGEVTTPGVDIFDKEATFIEDVIKVRGTFCHLRYGRFSPIAISRGVSAQVLLNIRGTPSRNR